MKGFISFGLLASLLVIAALTIRYLQGSEQHCSGINAYKEASWNGKVTNKYLDSLNHGYQTLLVQESYGINKVYFTTDTSRFYQIIQVGDLVEKAKDSLAVYVTTRVGRKRHLLKCVCN